MCLPALFIAHRPNAIMSMKAGKPVYIEKPMAVTYEECCRINRISKKREFHVRCYYRRYLPYFKSQITDR